MLKESLPIDIYINRDSISLDDSSLKLKVENTKNEILQEVEIQESPKNSYDEVRIERTISVNTYTNNNYIVENYKQLVGRVISLKDNCFVANLEEPSGFSTRKIATFNLNSITVVNRELLKEGAMFYWTVGLFRNKKTKELRKKSEIIIRRPLKINIENIDILAKEEAERLYRGIAWLD